MFNSRLVSLIRKEFIQIMRDPRTLALTFALPVMQLILLGYAATNDVRNIPIAVFDQDRSAPSRELLDKFRAADYFALSYEAGSEEELRALVDDGTVGAGIIIPPDYSDDIRSGATAQVMFVLDGTDPTSANTALAGASQIGANYATELAVERLNAVGNAEFRPALEVRSRVWYNPDLESAFFMIPGMIGIILQFLTTMLTATAIVRERERGTIEQLIVTPIRATELIVGKVTPFVLISFFNVIEILVAGMLLFGIPLNGSLPLLLALSGLFVISSLGLGIFISTISNTQQEAILSTYFLMLPAIFLSGFFFPLAAMPVILQWISLLFPLRYYLVIVRAVILKGVGIGAIENEVLALLVFSILITAAAVMRFRKRLD